MTNNTTDYNHQPFEDVFKRMGIHFKLVPEFKLDDLVDLPESQVRHGSHKAPKPNVDAYAEQMGHGAEFPPIVAVDATQGAVLCDGNTRTAAARKIGRVTFPVYLLRNLTVDEAFIVSGVLNQIGGQRLDTVEGKELALRMMEQDYSDAEVAELSGQRPETVRRWRREKRFDRNITDCGIDMSGVSIPQAAKVAFSEVREVEPLREIVESARNVQWTTKSAKEAAKAASEGRSDAEKVAAIKAVSDKLDHPGPRPVKPRRETAFEKLTRDAAKMTGRIVKIDPPKVLDAGDARELYQVWSSLADAALNIAGTYE